MMPGVPRTFFDMQELPLSTSDSRKANITSALPSVDWGREDDGKDDGAVASAEFRAVR